MDTVLVHDTLLCRLERYRRRYGEDPDSLPVTLDEWVDYARETWDPWPIRVVPMSFRNIPLRLVAEIHESSTGLRVKP